MDLALELWQAGSSGLSYCERQTDGSGIPVGEFAFTIHTGTQNLSAV